MDSSGTKVWHARILKISLHFLGFGANQNDSFLTSADVYVHVISVILISILRSTANNTNMHFLAACQSEAKSCIYRSLAVCRFSGESNTNANYSHYACAQREMVEDWRLSWLSKSGTSDPQLPFGLVQAG